jgi:hypothetical protein
MGRINRLFRLAIPAAVASLAAIGAIVTPARSAAVVASTVSTSFTIPGYVHDVASISADNAWAVGAGFVSATEETLILHWNGKQWSQVTSPKPVSGELYSVTAVSANNAWAVGETASSEPLIMHWNGKAWSRQTDIPAISGELNAVVVSGNTVWAAGESNDFLDSYFLHRVGNSWSIVPVPAPANSGFFGLAAAGRNIVWSVGGATINGEYHGLVMRWNGTAWKSVSSPLQGAGNGLYGVAAGPAGTLWAVGADFNSNRTDPTATSMLWNGKNWRKVPVGPFPRNSVLDRVTFFPNGTAWAVGSDGTGALILRWSGSAWIQVANPDDAKTGQFISIAATSSSNAWAAGYFYKDSQPQTLILHWNGKTWS